MSNLKFKNYFIIISGPSGVGKNTIINELLKICNKNSKKITYSVSYTTRKKREGEKNGINYYFVDNKKFKEMIDDQKFLEYAVYNNFFYGTSLKWVSDTLKINNVICEIDVQGFLNIEKKYKNILPILSFFILPPNENELKKRIIDRNSNDIQHIENRINISRWEIKNKNKYDHVIINNSIKITTKKIYEILKKYKFI